MYTYTHSRRRQSRRPPQASHLRVKLNARTERTRSDGADRHIHYTVYTYKCTTRKCPPRKLKTEPSCRHKFSYCIHIQRTAKGRPPPVDTGRHGVGPSILDIYIVNVTRKTHRGRYPKSADAVCVCGTSRRVDHDRRRPDSDRIEAEKRTD